MAGEESKEKNDAKLDYNPGRYDQLPIYLKACFVGFTVIGVAAATILTGSGKPMLL